MLRLPGQLTASLHGQPAEIAPEGPWGHLLAGLEDKAGRLIFNGYGTGIDVCAAMNHGGPYPATSHPGFTSIGHRALLRFVRPVCYQNFPASALPPALSASHTNA